MRIKTTDEKKSSIEKLDLNASERLCRESLLLTSWVKLDLLGRFSQNFVLLTDKQKTNDPGFLLAIKPWNKSSERF